MFFPKLLLTDSGCEMIVNALTGDVITFTKIAIGTGDAPADIRSLTSLVRQNLETSIVSIAKGDKCVSLTATFTNSDVTTGFAAKEIGVFAKNAKNEEYLYAYANSAELATFLPAYTDQALFQTTFNVLVAIGDATTVNAVLGEYSGFTRKDDFDNHLNNRYNPHKVTKEQVGLGNVQNVSVNNQQPTVQSNYSSIDIKNGDTLSLIVTKLRNAVNKLKSHLSDRNNPHKVTPSQIGAAYEVHSHDVDVLSSVLKTKTFYNSLFNDVDFNDFKTPGLYELWGENLKNKPASAPGQVFLIVIGSKNNERLQIAILTGQISDSPRLYMRKFNDNSNIPWQDWSNWDK